jgi:hypothetical protein
MGIPAAPVGRFDVASTVLALFGQVHDQVRHAVRSVDDAGLNWAPTARSNSIATIVTHLVGSEAETLRCVAGVPCERDRPGEFTRGPQRMAQVLGALRGADALVEELRPAIGPNRLQGVLALPTLAPEQRRTGLAWLIGNYGHAQEHVGEIQLTIQLYLDGVGAR